jgi:hypothetical protein
MPFYIKGNGWGYDGWLDEQGEYHRKQALQACYMTKGGALYGPEHKSANNTPGFDTYEAAMMFFCDLAADRPEYWEDWAQGDYWIEEE